MILIGIGANLPSKRYGTPVQTCEAALSALDAAPGVRVARRSRWFESAPVPLSDQPWYVNGACVVETDLSPHDLLRVLHAIEADFGRVRGQKNAARVLDLDLLAYDDVVSAAGDLDAAEGGNIEIPHPRLDTRAFVLLPLQDLVPGWSHPQTGIALSDLIAALSPDQIARPLEELHIPDEDHLGAA